MFSLALAGIGKKTLKFYNFLFYFIFQKEKKCLDLKVVL